MNDAAPLPSPEHPGGRSLIAVMCAAEVLTMIGAFGFPALVPTFIAEWHLTNTEAGWIGGIHIGAYAVGAPVFVALTDRVDARRIYILGAALTAIAFSGFAVFAEGFWTALFLRIVAGFGLAATYMPGLRILADRFEGRTQSRALAFYTSSFSLGAASSFLIVGEAAAAFGWRPAFFIAAVAAALPMLAAWFLVTPAQPHRAESETLSESLSAIFDFRPVLKNRRAMGYVVAYGAHGWELFAMRAWIVAFLAYSLTLQPGGGWSWLAPTTVATLSGLVAMASSILGAEAASRWGRRRVISIVMVTSGLVALFIGFLPGVHYAIVVALMLVYAVTIQADSAALTTGAVNAAEEGRRGATLAVHSLIGFTGGAIGPIAVGWVLDLSGGGMSALSWGLGFAVMGLPVLLGPLMLYRRAAPLLPR